MSGRKEEKEPLRSEIQDPVDSKNSKKSKKTAKTPKSDRSTKTGSKKSKTKTKTPSGKSDEKKKGKKKKKGSQKEEKDNDSEKKKKSENEEEEEDEGPAYGPQHAVKVLLPVTICVWICAVAVINAYKKDDHSVEVMRQNSAWNMMKESKDKSGAQNAWRAVVNALAMLGAMIVLTFIMLALYYFKLYKILWCLLGFSIIAGLLVNSFIVLRRLFTVFSIAISFISFTFLVLNFVVAGSLTILWKGPLRLQQVFMVFISLSASLLIFSILPEWTGWVVLGLLVCWDLFAVLAPCGPLKKFVELAQERDERGDGPLAALVFTSGMVYFPNTRHMKHKNSDTRLAAGCTKDKADEKDGEGSKKEKKDGSKKSDKKAGDKSKKGEDKKDGEKKPGEEDEEPAQKNIQLGLGDFVFYSTLISKVADTGCWTTIIACYITIITGLLATLTLLIMLKKALPALPISIAFGMIFYFAGEYAMLPYQDECNRMEILY